MQYFGTDGIRGEFGKGLTLDLVLKVGMSSGKVFSELNYKKVCLGEDPRISSPVITKILIGALNSFGIEVYDMGVVPTAAVSYTIVNEDDIHAGIMVSASHNPYIDNGIKFFGDDGKKISAEIEEKIEGNLDTVDISDVTKIVNSDKDSTGHDLVEKYHSFVLKHGVNLEGVRIGLDTANGSSYKIAPRIFRELGAVVYTVGDTPDGININQNVGSTHPEQMQELVKKENLDFAFCYDGDADRVQLIDNEGNLLDGDYILYLLAKYLKKEGLLQNNGVVSTVMSNLGYKKAMEELNIDIYETQVGDKYVMREMDEKKIILGGEQSGHIILSDYISTGDGLMTSIILSKIITAKDFSFKELHKELVKFPQVLHNHISEDKEKILGDREFNSYIEKENDKLFPTGRILVRPSGTEPLIRIMVEARTVDECNRIITEVLQKL